MPWAEATEVRSLFESSEDFASATEAEAASAVSMAQNLVRGYIHREWIDAEVPPPVKTVVTLIALRLLLDFAQRQSTSYAIGEWSESWRGGFAGFTLAERLVLDRHRERVGVL